VCTILPSVSSEAVVLRHDVVSYITRSLGIGLPLHSYPMLHTAGTVVYCASGKESSCYDAVFQAVRRKCHKSRKPLVLTDRAETVRIKKCPGRSQDI
jgi:hypothetical protein